MKRRIVIAEDDGMMRTLYARMIRTLLPDDEILIASNGLEAWILYDQQRPDLMISDLNMPELDGWQLFMRVKDDCEARDLPPVPFLFCTAVRGSAATVDEYESSWPLCCILKPFSIELLHEKIRLLLE